MIATVVPPRHCHHCNTTWAICVNRREYQSDPCCRRCDHEDRPRICATCGATDTACAVKAGVGGRVCCESCSHVVTRKVNPTNDRETEMTI